MEEPNHIKCPQCGRPIYEDRPACLYCGFERSLKQEEKAILKKNLVNRLLMDENSENIEQIKIPSRSNNCPHCGKQLADGAKFCTGCGKKTDSPPVNVASPPETVDISKTNTHSPPLKTGTVPLKELKDFSLINVDNNSDRKNILFILLNPKGNLLWAVSSLFFLLAIILPFARTPDRIDAKMVFKGLTLSFEPALLLFYLMAAVSVFLHFYQAPPPQRKDRYIIGFAAASLLLGFILDNEVFSKNKFQLIFFTVIFVYFILKKSESWKNSDFWRLISLETASIMLAFTFSIKACNLSDAAGSFSNLLGYSSHLTANLIFIAGCVMRKTKETVNDDGNIREEDRSESSDAEDE